MMLRRTALAALFLWTALPAAAQSFDYYLLALSWAPDFCAQPGGRKDPAECAPGRRLGFVVHGLWPQDEAGRGPERCGASRPVSQEIRRVMLSYMPSEGLIQHEWTTHGTCTGLSAADYFSAVRRARDRLTIPAELKRPGQPIEISPRELESKFAAANPSFPAQAFRTSCNRGALQEVRVCLTKELAPRPCPASVHECPASRMTMLEVK